MITLPTKVPLSWMGLVLFILVQMALIGQAAADSALYPLPQHVDYNKPKALLGRRLFFDPRLSSTNEVSCASCHHPDFAGADGKKSSTGVKNRVGGINSPTVYNSVFNFRQFWNGRAMNLAEQAVGPLHNPMEMDMNMEKVEQRLNADADYRAAFAEVFGKGRIHFNQVIDAIVEFEKALVTPNAKFDRFLRGEVELSPKENRGYLLFKSAGCIVCHNGINLGGNSFQYLGAVNPLDEDVTGGDRFELTQDPFDRNRFKVPSLRNVALTAPYLHDGSMPTLQSVLKVMAYHNLGFRPKDNQITDLIAFLNTLTGDRPAILGAK